MINFQNGDIFKLRPCDLKKGYKLVNPLLIDDEEIAACFVTVRDYVVFTNKRIISVNVQGVSGAKKDFTSMPYRKIQTFSIETSGVFDVDCFMVIYFSHLGTVNFEFTGDTDIKNLCQIMSSYIL